MGANKIVMNTPEGAKTLIDLTEDTVTAETLAEGATAHNRAGEKIVGQMPITSVLYTEQSLTEEQQKQARLNIKAMADGPVSWDNISGKPFSRALVWDGTPGPDDLTAYVHKVSDEIPPLESLYNGGSIILYFEGETHLYEWSRSNLTPSSDGKSVAIAIDLIPLVNIYYFDNVSEGATTGIYFVNLEPLTQKPYYPIELLINGYSFEGEGKEKLNKEALPAGVLFTTDETLRLENGILSVNTALDAEQDNTLPITSAAVYEKLGNIELILGKI